ncbi:MAG: PAS domain S-box protein, partial [Actinomycetota bacterium]|nr:PAS domain S-box protein [Actinomycetota bacterium]
MPSSPHSVPALGAVDAFAAALTETTQSLVCVLDREGRILVFNDACERTTGFTRDEVLGADARDFVIPPEEGAAFGEVLAHVWATGEPSPQVGHWLRRDGSRRLVAWSNKPVLGEDGTPMYLVTSGLDITDRQASAAEIHALEGDLAAKLAEVGRLAQEQTALRRVATLVAAGASQEAIFDAVSKQCARVLGAGAAAVFRFDEETATIVGRYDREGIPVFGLGASVPLGPNSAIGRVHATGEPVRIDDYSDVPGEVAEVMRQVGLHATVAAPITVEGRVWGAVAVTTPRPEPFPAGSEARLRDFCELVSLAVESAEAREELRASRARIVQAADAERKRLERNLHDGAQQRLVSLALKIRLARVKISSDGDVAEQLLQDSSVELDAALRELRELARGLHPAVLTEHGLRRALQVLVERSPFPVSVDAPEERLPEPVETAAYYIVSEALANAAKHAEARSGSVTARRDDGSLVVEVRDDGRGGADLSGGSGIVGLRDRAE